MFRYFSNLAVDAVLRLKGTGNLQSIQVIKIKGGLLEESFLDEGFLLEKKVNSCHNRENFCFFIPGALNIFKNFTSL